MSARKSATPAPNDPLKILAADDEPSILNLVFHTLKPYPYAVTTVDTAHKALASIKRNPPDILITDIHMPGMSGLELVKAALKVHPDLLAIAITGYGDVATAVEFMKSGGIDFLQKPVNRDVLRLSIGAAADRWRLRNELADANRALTEKNRQLEAEIVERKRSEKALADSEQRYRRIFAGAPVGIFQCDPAGRFLRVNPTLARMFGYEDPEEMVSAENSANGESESGGGGGLRKNVAGWRDAVARSRTAVGGEWITAGIEGFTRTHQRIIVRNTLRTVRDESNAPIHIEGFVEDVTEKERRQAAFHREMKRAHDLYDLAAAPGLPMMPGLAIDIACIPAERVGGDLLDILRIDDRRCLIFMADITGHGIPAAMTANTLKTLFRAVAENETNPAAVCRRLNRTIHRFILPDDVISVFCGLLDLSAMSLTYYLSGLPGPLILRAGAVLPIGPTGLPFGVFGDFDFECRRIFVKPGDRLIAVTDGITEATNPSGEVFGHGRLRESAALLTDPARPATDGIIDMAAHFRKREGFTDDVIVMALSFFDDGPPPDWPIHDRFQGPDKCRFRLETRRIRIDAAMGFIMDHIRKRIGNDDPTAFEALKLAFNEVFVNAVEHGALEMTDFKQNRDLYDSNRYWTLFAERAATPPYAERCIDIECRYDGRRAILSVADEGPGFNPSQAPDPRLEKNRNRHSGRGIAIARMNVDYLHYAPDGRKVTLVKTWGDGRRPLFSRP